VCAGQGLDRHARLAQSGEVSLHGAPADPEVAGQLSTGHRMAGRAEELDDPLLPGDPAQGEVVVP
jgi:hypothetical protein